MKPRIVIDFDGTIVEHAFPGIGELKPGVKDAMTRLSEKYWIIISSCRNSRIWSDAKRRLYIQHMCDFLVSNDIHHDGVDFGTEGKPIADAYIDDKGIRFEDNWSEIADRLLKGEEE